MESSRERIIQVLLEEGFDRAGVCGPGPFDNSEYFETWLESGFHGEMHYLARDPQRRKDARLVRDWVKSIVVVALDYNTEAPHTMDVAHERERGWISRYAWGDDYHLVMEKMLKRAVQRLEQETGNQFPQDHGGVGEACGREAVLDGLGKYPVDSPQKRELVFWGPS